MVEKKFVIDGMKLSYNGPFEIIEFYKKVEDWIAEKGKEKDIKKKLEHVEKNGKNIEWFIEIWEDATEYARTIVRMRAMFKDVKEAVSTEGKARKRINTGNALIVFDGILETDLGGKWQQKPIFYFLSTIVDKYVHKFRMSNIEDKLAKDVYELHDRLAEFFNSYKI